MHMVKKGSQMRKGSFKICLFILNCLWMIKSKTINGLKNWSSKLLSTLWLPTVDKLSLIGTDYRLIASCLTTLVCFKIATNKTRIQIAPCVGIHKEWHMALLKICIIPFELFVHTKKLNMHANIHSQSTWASLSLLYNYHKTANQYFVTYRRSRQGEACPVSMIKSRSLW